MPALDSRRLGLLAALVVACLLAGYHGVARGDKETRLPAAFAVATVYIEQNATDGDAEVVFEVRGRKDGLAKLSVVAPDGRTVIDFAAPGGSASLGIRQFRLETPEPRDIKSLLAAYPEGVYAFAATTAAGERLQGKAALSHALPAPASLLQPTSNAREVDGGNLRITWRQVEGVIAYIVKIEQPKLGIDLTARLPGAVTAFGVPSGLLQPGAEYTLAVGTVSNKGNVSFTETSFTTAGRR